MDTAANQSGDQAPEVGVPDLVAVCRLLNVAGVHYLIYGGLACLLHGHERMTRDADIYIGPERDNIALALNVLRKWGHGYASELTVDDVLENVVVKICDVVVLDVAAEVWKLDWVNAWRRRRVITIDGVEIPFLCRADLIKSKETYRERDKWDIDVLKSFQGSEPGRAIDG